MPRLQPRALLANLALSAGVLLACLGLAEGLSRWAERRAAAGPQPHVEYLRGWQEWRDDFYQFGRSVPSWPPEAATNRDGLRDAHHTLDTPAGHERVLVLGDSVTYGLGLEARNAFPQVLQRLLDEQGARLEVFNAGVPGWSTRQERIAYQRLLRPYGARQALLAVCLNDPLELQLNLARPPAWLVLLHERSALLRRVVNAAGRELKSVEALNREPDGAQGRDALARFADEVLKLRAELQSDGATLGLLLLPYRFQVGPAAPAPALQARLMAFAREQALPAQDLLPALLPLGEAAFVDENHLSVRGSAAVAEALLAGPLLPRPGSHALRLAEEGREAGPERLLEWLSAAQPELRAAAAWRLQRSELDERLSRALVRAAADEPLVRYEALRALGRARALPEAREALLQALFDPRESLRLAAARALWALPPLSEDAGRLSAGLVHDDLYVRAFAEEALARLGPGAIPSVVPLLAHAEAGVRRRSARWLGRFGPGALPALEALVERLADGDAGVRRQAARVLGQIGPAAAGALPALRRAAEADADAQVRGAAEQALRRVQAAAGSAT